MTLDSQNLFKACNKTKKKTKTKMFKLMRQLLEVICPSKSILNKKESLVKTNQWLMRHYPWKVARQ